MKYKILGIIFFIVIGTLYFSVTHKTRINVVTNTQSPITKNVLVLNFNPTIESQSDKKLTETKNWSDPFSLQQQYIDVIKAVSHDFVNYSIVETITIDDYPIKLSGYQFTDEEYLACSLTHTCNSEKINYQDLLEEYHVCDRVNSGEINELWLWGGPWFGYYEANLAGPNAFFTVSPATTGTTCQKQLNIMGFNYERQVVEMLHDFGHRTEGTMAEVYKTVSNNPYRRFISYAQTSPWLSGCGTIHYPPNGTSDYNYDNHTIVENNCEDWLNYPNLTGLIESFACDQWGCNQLDYLKWWLSHLPHVDGASSGILNNWWKYVVDFEAAEAVYPLELQNIFATTSCEGSNSIATIYWPQNTAGPSDYVVDINDAENSWNSVNGFWHSNLISQINRTTTAPTRFRNVYSGTEPMPPLDPFKIYYFRVFYRSLNLYSNTFSFIPKDCSSSIPGDFTDINDTSTDQVNIFDFNELISKFQTSTGISYTIFDYTDLVVNFSK